MKQDFGYVLPPGSDVHMNGK